MKLDYIEIWKGDYRGIRFEINQVHGHEDKWWTYYLHLIRNRMQSDDFELFNVRARGNSINSKLYYPTEKIDSLLDFHGGCTYCEKEKGLRHNLIKVGCDYHHSWDEENEYRLDDIVYDVKKIIDEFLEKYSYKRWCGTCGSIEDIKKGRLLKEPDEGVYNFECSKHNSKGE